jgi:Uma2 family endonuclease
MPIAYGLREETMNRNDERPEDIPEKPEPDRASEDASESSPAVYSGGQLLILAPEDYPDYPDISHLVTEDGKPVDNIYVERQYRLLTDPLENSWAGPGEGIPFVTLTNVGLFSAPRQPALVPDFLFSAGVQLPKDLRQKEHRSYFIWEFNKPPDAVLEIVSDRRGGEDTLKMRQYAQLRIWYYVIYDPDNLLSGGVLRVFELRPTGYELVPDNKLKTLGLSLTLWQGTYEHAEAQWLRWCDKEGVLIPTGAERADEEKRRADELAERLKRLEAQLRAQGIEPSA